jgi:hypothetical protein
MGNTEKSVRQSVSLPTTVARRVKALAKTEKTSANRVIVDLIEAGLASKEAEKERFFALANQLTESTDRTQREKLKKELARMTFGEWCRRFSGPDLPPALRQHLFDRLEERKITVDDLYQLKLWRESEPEAPDGEWYKDFGSFKICGEGKFPKTFLLKGQAAKGKAL